MARRLHYTGARACQNHYSGRNRPPRIDSSERHRLASARRAAAAKGTETTGLKPCIPALALLVSLSLSATATAQEKTLVYCSQESPDTFNPQLSTSAATFDATSRVLYDRLVRFSDDHASIEPALAESWDISPDGRRYVFHLRPHVAFHTTPNFSPTRPFGAADVLYSFARQSDPDHPLHHVSGGRYPYYAGMGLTDLVRRVERIDDRTVAFTLAEPNASFLAILAMDFASILSAEYAERMLAAGTPERVDREPVGTGPFRLVQYQRDALIRYEVNAGYWAGRAPLDQLVFAITPDASVRFQRLRDGECDIIDAPDPADLPAMQADPRIDLVQRIEPDMAYLAFNTRLPKLADPRIRRALALAIDRAAIVEEAYHGLAVPAAQPIPSTIWPTDGSGTDGRPDLERSRALLAEAGAAGLAVTLWAPPVRRPYLARGRRVAEMIRADWQKVGVDANVVVPEWKDFLKNSMVGQHEAILFGWTAETADPDIFLTPLLDCAAARRGANRALWCNQTFDRLLAAARKETDRQAREAIYREALAILAADAPLTPLVHSVTYTPVRSRVVGYRPPVQGGHAFYGVDVR